MKASTHNFLRTAYYVGIAALVMNSLSVTNKLVGWFLAIRLPTGNSILELTAIGVAIGAGFAFARKFG